MKLLKSERLRMLPKPHSFWPSELGCAFKQLAVTTHHSASAELEAPGIAMTWTRGRAWVERTVWTKLGGRRECGT